MILISPSILSSDFANLAREVGAIADGGADLAHVDVMDGNFVPNITIGVPVVASLKKVSALPLDVHLMISDPLFYIPAFLKAGSDMITFHLESDSDVSKTIDAIRSGGAKAGVALKPATPAEAVFPYLDRLDMVLVMTVEPGFGGQKYIEDSTERIRLVRAMLTEKGLDTDLEVDGGIHLDNVELVLQAGANVIVAGSAIFGANTEERAVSFMEKLSQRGVSHE